MLHCYPRDQLPLWWTIFVTPLSISPSPTIRPNLSPMVTTGHFSVSMIVYWWLAHVFKMCHLFIWLMFSIAVKPPDGAQVKHQIIFGIRLSVLNHNWNVTLILFFKKLSLKSFKIIKIDFIYLLLCMPGFGLNYLNLNSSVKALTHFIFPTILWVWC